jgi:hypothetical protein
MNTEAMKKTNKAPLILVVIWLMTSCVKHVDFEQVDQFYLRPVFQSSLVYFTLNQINFFDTVNSVEIVSPVDDISGFEVFKNSFVRDNLIKADLEIIINNQFDRRFTVNVVFLDDDDKVTHSFNEFIVAANDNNFKRLEVIEIANNQAFLTSTKVKVSIKLSQSSNGSTIDPNLEQTLTFKSAGTFFLRT